MFKVSTKSGKVILVTGACPFKTRLSNPSISAHVPWFRGTPQDDGRRD